MKVLPAVAALSLAVSAFSVPAMAKLPPCARDIAEHYGLPYLALKAVHKQEAGRVGLVVTNEGGGSQDMGLMQINTFWEPHLEKFGISRRELINDGCQNVAVGAWILRQEVNRFDNWRDAFAAYNAGAGNLEAGRDYARQVMKYWRAMRLGNR